MKLIPIFHTDKCFVIDDEDYDLVMKYKWKLISGRVYTTICHGLEYSLTRVLTGEKFIDHKDRNPFKNTRSNLRKASYRQQVCNRDKWTNSTSKFKGVGFFKDRNQWRARIMIMRKDINLGYFDSEIEAAKAYNEAALKYHGEFDVLNKI